MQDWVASYYKKVIRALYEYGKHQLAIGYDHFLAMPTKWF